MINEKWFVISMKLTKSGDVEDQFLEGMFDEEKDAKEKAVNLFNSLSDLDQKDTGYQVFKAKEWAGTRQKELGLTDKEDAAIDACNLSYSTVMEIKK